MAKAEIFQDLSLLPRTGGEERWRWLYTELRRAILDGRLKRGGRVPSTRSLARQYGLSRGTVLAAFDQLLSEGYTRAEKGSGTYVSSGIPDQTLSAEPSSPAPQLPQSAATISRQAQQLITRLPILPASRSVGKAFRSWEPAIDLFPVNLWARIAGRVYRRAARSLYGQGTAGGYLPLRKAIAEYAGTARGVRCDPGQIIITSGAQQALDLIARAFLDPGDSACIEDPCYPGSRFAFSAAGAQVVPVPVDREGLDVTAARGLCPNPRVIYTTPANQFPLGITMTLDRRLALLHWAAKTNAWVVEDDYDAEYRYSGKPVGALQSLDQSGCVVYVGTFTKLLFNSLRLGFLIVPPKIVHAFEAIRSVMDRHPPTLDQAVLAEFILEGHFGHHVRRMRQIYSKRLAILRSAAREEMDEMIDVVEASAGMRTLGWLKGGVTDEAVAARARALGLELAALSEFTIQHRHRDALILGFAGCNAGELRRGVSVLRTAVAGIT